MLNPTLDTLAAYLARVAPALVLGAAVLLLARREPREGVSPVGLSLHLLLQAVAGKRNDGCGNDGA